MWDFPEGYSWPLAAHEPSLAELGVIEELRCSKIDGHQQTLSRVFWHDLFFEVPHLSDTEAMGQSKRPSRLL